MMNDNYKEATAVDRSPSGEVTDVHFQLYS